MKKFFKAFICLSLVALMVASMAVSVFAATKRFSGYKSGAGSISNYTVKLNGAWYGKTEYVTINNYSNRQIYAVVGGVGKYINPGQEANWRYYVYSGGKTLSVKVQPNGGSGNYSWRVATTSGTIR